VPTMRISTAKSTDSIASGGMPDCSCPSSTTVRLRAALRSPSRIASSANSTATNSCAGKGHDCAQEGAEVDAVQWSQRRRYQVIPASMAARTTLGADTGSATSGHLRRGLKG
jgi:hypothetical protein